MKYERINDYLKIFIDDSYEGKTIKEFFDDLSLSRKTIHLLRQNKEYTINHQYKSYDEILHKGDVLDILAYDHDDHMYRPLYEDINIVYEDELILVVNKPPFLPVYPDRKDKTDSLSNMVSGYYHSIGEDIPVRFIHRLDVETSGLVMFVKCLLIQSLLDLQLSKKEIERKYLAVVENKLERQEGRITGKIGRDRHSNKMRISKTGKPAFTEYEVLKTIGNRTLVECALKTGRTHQIRVHMASIGHPLVGDTLYGRASKDIKRQALHAYLLTFTHPLTKEVITLEAELPEDMKQLI